MNKTKETENKNKGHTHTHHKNTKLEIIVDKQKVTPSKQSIMRHTISTGIIELVLLSMGPALRTLYILADSTEKIRFHLQVVVNWK